MTQRNIISGIQTSGSLHLGNLLGAIEPMVKMDAMGGEKILFLADLHAITVKQEPSAVRQSAREIAAAIWAWDKNDNIKVYRQSAVSAHSELAWILNCVARVGWLTRMPQFKEKGGENSERASVGLMTYPVLQAADILLHDATHVPVGDDQKHHLDLTRDIAKKFNNDFEEVFTIPEAFYALGKTKVLSLRDGESKMSKSDPVEGSRINLLDTPDTIIKKINKARTDALMFPEDVDDYANRIHLHNLVGIYCHVSNQTIGQTLEDFGGKGYGNFKKALGEALVEYLRPYQAEMHLMLNDPDSIDARLEANAVVIRRDVSRRMAHVKKVVGF